LRPLFRLAFLLAVHVPESLVGPCSFGVASQLGGNSLFHAMTHSLPLEIEQLLT
jgi:hypothetical protein